MLFADFCAEYGITHETRSALGGVLVRLLKSGGDGLVHLVNVTATEDALLDEKIREGIRQRES